MLHGHGMLPEIPERNVGLDSAPIMYAQGIGILQLQNPAWGP